MIGQLALACVRASVRRPIATAIVLGTCALTTCLVLDAAHARRNALAAPPEPGGPAPRHPAAAHPSDRARTAGAALRMVASWLAVLGVAGLIGIAAFATGFVANGGDLSPLAAWAEAEASAWTTGWTTWVAANAHLQFDSSERLADSLVAALPLWAWIAIGLAVLAVAVTAIDAGRSVGRRLA